MTLGNILGVIFPILTIVVGGACILLLSVTKTLRDSNGDLRDRVGDLETNELRHEATIKAQAGEIAALQKVVTAADAIATLTAMVAHVQTDLSTLITRSGP